MTMVETTYAHVVVDEAGVPWIAGTTTKVVEVILDQQAYGLTPQQIHEQHPTLSLGQIYSAFAYYEDHKAALDDDSERRLRQVEQVRQVTPPNSVQDRVRHSCQES